MSVSLSADDAKDWTYVGEGNQNLVVRYHGERLFLKDKVLRVYKSNQKDAKGPDEHAILFKQQFVEYIIGPLLGHEYIVAMTPVKTSRGFLEQLASHVQPFRPDSRLKNSIVIDAPFSMLMDDLMSMLTFELKPKWGFKPSSTHPKKRLYCRYCMHSHMKQIPIHDYCPLDLYSGDQARIQKALVSLFTAPLEKTLRTYVNNSPVCLEQAMFEEIRMQDILEHILVQDPILSRLKSLQSRLDALDVESILPLYQQYQSSIFHTTDIAVWQIVVKRFFNRQPLLEKEQSLQKIYEYVLSMTFKDCSIMINVNKTTEKDKRTVDVNGSLFSYDVKVIDTDLKNLEKIPYWHQLDQAIVQHAVDTCFEKQECK